MIKALASCSIRAGSGLSRDIRLKTILVANTLAYIGVCLGRVFRLA
jgi:hypothetical protein